MKKYVLLSSLFLLQCSKMGLECAGTLEEEQKTAYCTEKSPDERSMLAMKQGNFSLAQTLLENLIHSEPTSYFRYPRLAAVYAIQAGFILLDADITKISGTGFSTLTHLFPSPKGESRSAFQKKMAKMNAAKTLLLQMPEVERTSGKTSYGASAQFQLTVYLTAFAAMTLNQFFSADGQVDPTLLQTLSAEDAVNILGSLVQAAQASGKISPTLTPKIQEVLDEIDQANGESSQQKIQDFIQSHAS